MAMSCARVPFPAWLCLGTGGAALGTSLLLRWLPAKCSLGFSAVFETWGLGQGAEM